MAKKRGFFWSITLCALFTFIALVLIMLFFGDRFLRPAVRTPAPVKPEIEKQAVKEINLFLGSVDGKSLKAVKYEIKKGFAEDELKAAVTGLITGNGGTPDDTVPKGTRLLSLKIKNAVAHVNLSEEVRINHPGGSKGELLTIYSIVNTLTLNFPEIKKVQILIDGKVEETLAGHILIGIPLGPDKKLIKGMMPSGKG